MNNPFDFDSELKEECGVFGISEFEETKNENAVSLTIRGLFALQHRGQEAAGIVAFGPKGSSDFRGLGLVSDVFRPNEVAEKLNGTSAVGHVRYSTSGDNTNDDRAFRNIQPLFVDMALGGVAVAHNGNLTNTTKLRDDLIKKGCIFQSTIDTETILHLLATSSKETLMEN